MIYFKMWSKTVILTTFLQISHVVPGSIMRYLGANVGKLDLSGGIKTACFVSGNYYVKESLNAIATNLNKVGSKLDRK